MIFNWKTNSISVLKNKKYTLEDQNDKRTITHQEVMFVRYLISIGKDRDECFSIWKDIEGGVASEFGFDKDQCEIEFKKIYAKAIHGYKEGCMDEFDQEFNIYQEEIDYLNSLDAPYWVRQYWLGMLFWYKYSMLHYGSSTTDIFTEGWIFYQIDDKHLFKHKSDELKKWNRHAGFVVQRKLRQYETYIVLDWVTNKGKKIFSGNTPNDFKNAIYLLSKGTRVCTQCGKTYDFSSKTQRTICDECYHKNRNAYIKNKMQARRAEIKKVDK